MLLLVPLAARAQAIVNLRLEPDANRRQPLLLWSVSQPDPGTTLLPDTVVRAEGRGSMRLCFAGAEPGYLHAYTYAVAADSVRDAPVTIRARLRTADYRGKGTLYGFLTDVAGNKLAEVNFVDFSALDSLPRTADWHEVEIRLPAVGAAATSFGFGFRALGRGTLWLDDVRVLLGPTARPYRDAPLPGTAHFLVSEAARFPDWDFERSWPAPAALLPDGGRLVADSGRVPQHGRHSLRVTVGALPGSSRVPCYVGLGSLPVDTLGGRAVVVRGYYCRREGSVADAPAALYAALLFEGPQARHVARGDLHLTPLPAPTAAAWQAFAVRVSVPTDAAATRLALGVALTAGDTLWLDHFTFTLADGRPYVPRPAPPPPAPTAAEIAWLRRAAVPLTTVAPGAPATELAPLKGIIGEARVVGLGEVTHGARELFELKHRLWRWLAEARGFTTLVLEANMGACEALDDYVHTGQGDPAALLAPLGVWHKQELLDVVRWTRHYNQLHAAHPLSLRGMDMQTGSAALANLQAANDPPDPFLTTRYQQLAALLPELARGAIRANPLAEAEVPALHDVRRLTGEVRVYQEWRSRLVRSGETDLLRLADQAQQLRLLEQYATFATLPLELAGAYRDACMAENVTWLAGRAPGGKLVVWAHNAHVAGQGAERPLGQWLRATYGTAYVALGLTFAQGEYLAEGATGFYAARAQPAGPGTYEAYFRATNAPGLVLDLRPLQLQPATAWLFRNLRLRDIGIRENTQNFLPHNVRQEFDALIYWQNASAARQLK